MVLAPTLDTGTLAHIAALLCAGAGHRLAEEYKPPVPEKVCATNLKTSGARITVICDLVRPDADTSLCNTLGRNGVQLFDSFFLANLRAAGMDGTNADSIAKFPSRVPRFFGDAVQYLDNRASEMAPTLVDGRPSHQTMVFRALFVRAFARRAFNHARGLASQAMSDGFAGKLEGLAPLTCATALMEGARAMMSRELSPVAVEPFPRTLLIGCVGSDEEVLEECRRIRDGLLQAIEPRLSRPPKRQHFEPGCALMSLALNRVGESGIITSRLQHMHA